MQYFIKKIVPPTKMKGFVVTTNAYSIADLVISLSLVHEEPKEINDICELRKRATH